MAPASSIALASSFEDKQEEQEDSLDLPPPYYPSSESDYQSFPPSQVYCPPSQTSSSHNQQEVEQIPSPEPANIEQSSDSSRRRLSGYYYNARLGPIGNLVSIAAVATSRAASNTSNSALRSTLGFVAEYLTDRTERWQYNGFTVAEAQY